MNANRLTEYLDDDMDWMQLAAAVLGGAGLKWLVEIVQAKIALAKERRKDKELDVDLDARKSDLEREGLGNVIEQQRKFTDALLKQVKEFRTDVDKATQNLISAREDAAASKMQVSEMAKRIDYLEDKVEELKSTEERCRGEIEELKRKLSQVSDG